MGKVLTIISAANKSTQCSRWASPVEKPPYFFFKNYFFGDKPYYTMTWKQDITEFPMVLMWVEWIYFYRLSTCHYDFSGKKSMSTQHGPQLFRIIKNGFIGTAMLIFKNLNAKQIYQLTHYIRYFSRE